MNKALKRKPPSVLAIYHIMRKRADTIGCVWLAYCINSLYIFRKEAHRASLSFTLHGTSRLFRAANQIKRRRCQNEKIHFATYSISRLFLFVKFSRNHRSYFVTVSRSAFIMQFAFRSCRIAVCVGRPLSKDNL